MWNLKCLCALPHIRTARDGGKERSEGALHYGATVLRCRWVFHAVMLAGNWGEGCLIDAPAFFVALHIYEWILGAVSRGDSLPFLAK